MIKRLKIVGLLLILCMVFTPAVSADIGASLVGNDRASFSSQIDANTKIPHNGTIDQNIDTPYINHEIDFSAVQQVEWTSQSAQREIKRIWQTKDNTTNLLWDIAYGGADVYCMYADWRVEHAPPERFVLAEDDARAHLAYSDKSISWLGWMGEEEESVMSDPYYLRD